MGVITRRLRERSHQHNGLTRRGIVPDMRTRKSHVTELVDAFVALPSDLGTLKELLEAITLTQLGGHSKACGALDMRSCCRPLRVLLEAGTDGDFLKPEHRDMLVIEADAARLLNALFAWMLPTVGKWIGQPSS